MSLETRASLGRFGHGLFGLPLSSYFCWAFQGGHTVAIPFCLSAIAIVPLCLPLFCAHLFFFRCLGKAVFVIVTFPAYLHLYPQPPPAPHNLPPSSLYTKMPVKYYMSLLNIHPQKHLLVHEGGNDVLKQLFRFP